MSKLQQRMVIELSNHEDKKKRTKAFQTAAGAEGVIKVEIVDDNRLVLVGEGTDVVQLTTLLRKKLCHARVISVIPVDENPLRYLGEYWSTICKLQQRMVIELSIHEDKKKITKAFQTAAGAEGVIKVEIVDDNRLVLVGEGTDVVQLTTCLRKKLCHARVISVIPVDENPAEEEEEEEEEDGENTISTNTQNYYPNGVPFPYFNPCDPYFQWCIEYK